MGDQFACRGDIRRGVEQTHSDSVVPGKRTLIPPTVGVYDRRGPTPPQPCELGTWDHDRWQYLQDLVASAACWNELPEVAKDALQRMRDNPLTTALGIVLAAALAAATAPASTIPLAVVCLAKLAVWLGPRVKVATNVGAKRHGNATTTGA